MDFSCNLWQPVQAETILAVFQQTDRTQVKTHPASKEMVPPSPLPFFPHYVFKTSKPNANLCSLATSPAFSCLLKCSVHHQSSIDLVKIFTLRWEKRRVLREILSLALRLSRVRSAPLFPTALCTRAVLLEGVLASCQQLSGCYLWQL